LLFYRQLQNLSLRGRTHTVNVSWFCSPIQKFFAEQAEQIQLIEFFCSPIPKIFAATVNLSPFCSPIQKFFAAAEQIQSIRVAFIRQLQNVSLRGRTNTVNLSCFCSLIPKFVAARPNKYSQFELFLFANSTWVRPLVQPLLNLG
jgi:hypothetical protein